MFNFIKNIFSNKPLINEMKNSVVAENESLRKAVDTATALVEKAQAEVEFLKDELQRATSPIAIKKLTSLKFYALVPGAHLGPVETVFTLGRGRCGKVVEELEMELTEAKMVIKQWHDDGSYKVFTYLRQDIVGRIQECHEVTEVIPGSFHMDRVNKRKAHEVALRRHIWMR